MLSRPLERRPCGSALAALLLAALPSVSSAQEVFVADAMRKIRATEPSVPAAASASIAAARNEYEAFQIVVRGPATDVTATAGALVGPGGATLAPASCGAAGDVRLYREALYWVDPAKRSDVHSMTGWVPDALVPQVDEFDQECRSFSFSVPAGENRVIWADVHVPPDAPPGTYTGSVTVSWAGGSRIVPVTLRVWDFALPSTSSLRSYYGYPYNALTVQHGTPACSSALVTLLGRYAALALDHRMSFTMLDDGCSYTDVAGAYTASYGPLLDGTAATRLPGARATGIVYMGDPGSQAALGAWRDQFTSRGWFERLFEYAADEPNTTQEWSVVGPRARLAHSVDPRLRILVVTSIERARSAAPGSGFSVDQDVDVFVPNVDQLEPAPAGNTRSAYDAWLAGSDVKEVWQYLSCDAHGCGDADPVGSDPASGYYPRWPSYTIDASLMRARALEWFSFRNDLSGELYYSTADAFFGTNPGPWADQWLYTGHGDGTLFYPGTPTRIGGSTHVPVASMRMRMIREGMEDYEYMHLLESQGDRQFALDQVSTVFGPASDADRDPAALYGARERMACRILANLGRPCAVSQARLTLTKAGAGAGSVASAPAGIDCGAGCSSQPAAFAQGTAVTLTATPAAGSAFAGFSGTCTTAATSCTFSIDADAAVTATFVVTAPCDADDCFDRADGALGAAWNVFAPGIEVSSGQARATSTGTKGAEFLKDVGPEQDVSARCLVTGAGSNCAVIARYNGPNDYYYAYLDAGLGQVALWRKSGGAATRLGAAARAVAANAYHPLRLLVRGNTLEVYLDGDQTPAVSAVDSAIAAGARGGIHGYAANANAVSWDDFRIAAAPPLPRAPLFHDDFDRTTGLGSSWSVRYGSFTTDGAFAVSGPPPSSGDFARLAQGLGTSDYSVTARLVVPAGASRSGIVARATEGAKADRELYAARVSAVDGSVSLWRRNRPGWTQLATAAAGILPGTSHALRLSVTGSSPVHLEVWLDGALQIRLDDSSASRIASGVPAMQSFDANVRYDSFTVELP